MDNKYNILFSLNSTQDVLNICEYIDEFYHALGIMQADVDIGALHGVVSSMILDFPSHLQVKESSPFKKVAAFVTNFVASKPIHTAIPDFNELSTHQNAIVAFSLAIDSLHGAVINCKERGPLKLEQKIEVSQHFWKDTIAALSGCVPVHHFQLLSLLFESLAYQKNPSISYEFKI